MASQAKNAEFEIADLAAKHTRELESPNFRRSLTLNIYAWADPAHALLEILQNADDAGPAGGNSSVSIEFNFRSDGLIVRHDGQPFSSDDARGICSIGDSTKSAEKHIGFMGIGFKSVYKFAAAAYIKSGRYSFGFEPNNYPRDPYAWVIVPSWCMKFPVSGGKRGQTTLYLPYRPDIRDEVRAELESSANEIPAVCLLFLNHVAEIRILNNNGPDRIIRRQDDEIEDVIGEAVKRRRFRVFKRTFNVPPECRKAQRVKESHRDKVRRRQVTVAFEIDSKGSLRPILGDASFFAFLPTEERTRLPFIVQADFILDAQRSQIDRSLRWNGWLLEKSAEVLMNNAVRSFKGEDKARYRFLGVLPRPSIDKSSFVTKNMLDRIWERCRKSTIVPGKSGKWLRPEQAVLARKEIQALVDEAQLRQLNEKRGWVNPLTRGLPLLRELDVESFTEEELMDALEDTEWLSSKKSRWFVRLYRFLQDWKSREGEGSWLYSRIRLQGLRIVPTQAGGLATPNEVVFPPKQHTYRSLAERVPGLELVTPALSKGSIRTFLLDLSVSEFDLGEVVQRAVLPRVESGECLDWPVRDRLHVLRLLRNWLKSLRWQVPSDLEDTLGLVPLPSRDRKWHPAKELNIWTRRLQRLDPGAKFVVSRKEKDWAKFVQTLGVAPYLRLRSLEGDLQRWEEVEQPAKWSEYCADVISAPGYPHWVSGVVWLPALATRLPKEKASTLVEMLAEGWTDYYSKSQQSELRYTYRGRDRHQQIISYFSWQLAKRKWLPTNRGLRQPDGSVFPRLPRLQDAYGTIPAYLAIQKTYVSRGRALWQELNLSREVNPDATSRVLWEASRLKPTDSLKRQLAKMYSYVGRLLSGLVEEGEEDAHSEWKDGLSDSPLLTASGSFTERRKRRTYWADDRRMLELFSDEVEFVWYPTDVERSTIASFLDACSVPCVSANLKTSLGKIGRRIGTRDPELQYHLAQKKDLILSCVAHHYPSQKDEARELLSNLKVFRRDVVPVVYDLDGIRREDQAIVFFDRRTSRLLSTRNATSFDVALELCRVLAIEKKFAETVESVLFLSRPQAVRRLEQLGIAGIKFKPSDVGARAELETLQFEHEEQGADAAGAVATPAGAHGVAAGFEAASRSGGGGGAVTVDGGYGDPGAFDPITEARAPLPDLADVTVEFVEYTPGTGARREPMPSKVRLKSVSADSGKPDSQRRADPSVIGDRAEEIVRLLETDRLARRGLDPDEALLWVAGQNPQADHDFESLDEAGETNFIEVKAVTRDGRFRWTKNEFILAQRKRERYFLYLVFDPRTRNPRVVSYRDPIGLIEAQEMDLDFEVLLARPPLASKE